MGLLGQQVISMCITCVVSVCYLLDTEIERPSTRSGSRANATGTAFTDILSISLVTFVVKEGALFLSLVGLSLYNITHKVLNRFR